jgi:hypothetical protein
LVFQMGYCWVLTLSGWGWATVVRATVCRATMVFLCFEVSRRWRNTVGVTARMPRAAPATKKAQQHQHQRSAQFVIEEKVQVDFLRVFQREAEEQDKQNQSNDGGYKFHQPGPLLSRSAKCRTTWAIFKETASAAKPNRTKQAWRPPGVEAVDVVLAHAGTPICVLLGGACDIGSPRARGVVSASGTNDGSTLAVITKKKTASRDAVLCMLCRQTTQSSMIGWPTIASTRSRNCLPGLK